MARQEIVTVKILSDLSGKEGAQGWEFELLGRKFGIDLLETPEWEELKDLIERITPFLEAATDNSPGQATLPVPAQGTKPKADGPDPTQVRAWAKASGHLIDGKPINEKGRFSAAWAKAFAEAGDAEPASEGQDQAPKAPEAQEEPKVVTAQVYEEEEELDPASLPGRLEDDTDRQVADK